MLLTHVRSSLASLLVGFIALAGQAQAQYGAFAFDENTFNYGFRIGAADANQAQNDAMNWCRSSGGTNCKVSQTFSGNSCLTLAVGENRHYWFRVYDQGNVDQQAMFTIADSVMRCTSSGGYRCAAQVTMCASQQAAWQAPNQAKVSQSVLQYAAARTGQQVGDGECWTLANEALKASGAITPYSSNFDAYVFGKEVYRDFQSGDIIQWENVTLKTANSQYNFPHHTSIVASANGNVVNVYHQNINGDRHVRYETYDLSTKISGMIRVYRPIPRL